MMNAKERKKKSIIAILSFILCLCYVCIPIGLKKSYFARPPKKKKNN